MPTMLFLGWLNAVRKELKALITGSLLLGGLGLYQAITGRQFPWWLYAGLTALFLAWAFFGAWAEEHRNAEDAKQKLYDGRPLMALEVIPCGISAHQVRPKINLRNIGARPARLAKPQTVTSYQDKYELHFDEIDSVASTETVAIGYWVTSHQECQHTLWDFLRDVKDTDDPLQKAALIWWDIRIKYRDTDESVREELTRLCFDLQSSVLYTTAPPYTERGFKPRA